MSLGALFLCLLRSFPGVDPRLLPFVFNSILKIRRTSICQKIRNIQSLLKSSRVEVSEAVYHAYHKEREAERYQKKLIHQFELSLERFQDDGVNVEYLITRFQPSI